MRSVGWALIQYDWCSNEKGKFRHRDMEREDGYLQAKKRTWNRPLPHSP